MATDDAVVHFAHGPLARPRLSLVKNFVAILIKNLFAGVLTEDARQRYAAAWNATLVLHRENTERATRELLNTVLRSVVDDLLNSVILSFGRAPDAVRFLNQDVWQRIARYVENMRDNDVPTVLPVALDVEELRPQALVRLSVLDPTVLSTLIEAGPRTEYMARALELYCAATNFNEANAWARDLITPMIEFIERDHLERIAVCIVENDQIAHSTALPRLLRQIRRSEQIVPSEYEDVLKRLDIDEKVPWVRAVVEHEGVTEV